MRWLLFISIALYAIGAHSEVTPEVVDDGRTEPVDPEFLEYLGSLVFDGAAWVGPEDMVVPVPLEAEAGPPAEPHVQYQDAFERDLQEEPSDAG
jgi:hypothetical protein